VAQMLGARDFGRRSIVIAPGSTWSTRTSWSWPPLRACRPATRC